MNIFSSDCKSISCSRPSDLWPPLIRFCIYVSSYYTREVSPHLTMCPQSPHLTMCPHSTICVSAYCYMCTILSRSLLISLCVLILLCVRILLYVCPHSADAGDAALSLSLYPKPVSLYLPSKAPLLLLYVPGRCMSIYQAPSLRPRFTTIYLSHILIYSFSPHTTYVCAHTNLYESTC
jgi:hypothetical protein